VFGLDQNYVDVTGIGGAPSGHKQVAATCGGGESGLQARLKAIGNSGEAMLAASAAKGAKQPGQTRNVLVLQHYPGVCKGLEATFKASMPAGETVDFRCSFGHTHNTLCEAGTDADCQFSMNGGGGGCCSNDVVNSQAGFAVLTFKPEGGMGIELVKLGRHCNFAPEGMSPEERETARRFAHGEDHILSFAAAKLEVNAGLGGLGDVEAA